MKKILTAFVLAFVTVFASAQDIPAGVRMEFTEIEQNDFQYSIFSYKDGTGTVGYYLSLGREVDLLEIFQDGDSDFSLGHVDEICLLLGATADEASATLDSLAALLDENPGTTAEFPCRLTGGAEKLSVPGTLNCLVVKRLLQGKRLCFQFVNGRHTAEVDLTKSSLKSLRWGFNLGRKMHPNW